MRKGRKPHPTILRLIAGNPAKRPMPKDEPKPVGDLKDPPEWLNESQREGWAYAIEHAPPGLLKKLDRSVLVVWVIAEDTHRQANQKLQQHGMLMKTAQGTAIQTPFMGIQNRQAFIMLKAAAELGFTPSSRSQIRVEQSVTNTFASNGRREA